MAAATPLALEQSFEALRPGLVLDDRYALVELLSRGGMGTVWRADDLTCGGNERQVALKIMGPTAAGDKALCERFRRELEVGMSLKSANTVAYLGGGEFRELPYLVMELLEGEDLAARLARYGRMSSGECIPWLSQLLTGLSEAHESGIVHRDLSPRNLFFTRDQNGHEVLKILDFGIAVAKRYAEKKALTEPGTVIGSVHYMAPEQLRGAPVDFRTDLWAVAVILYRAIVGQRPFEGKGMQPLAAILRDPHESPSRVTRGLPPAIDRFFARALCKDPAGRHRSLDAFLDAFHTAAIGHSAPSLRAPRVPSELPTVKVPIINYELPTAVVPRQAPSVQRTPFKSLLGAAVLGVGAALLLFLGMWMGR